jgi:phenylalanyl-tRNA synthetase beta chain
MKVPYSWLKSWVDVPWEARELGARLTMAGFELEALTPAAPPFTNVVVAEILEARPHPKAERLRVCRVTMGQGEPLEIVCGASNARAGLKSALAVVGAVLPEDLRIERAQLRGIESNGMLCSAKELGLADGSTGILELAEDAPVGVPLRQYLELDDSVLEVNVTPNRGDAMSVLGIAREVVALSGRPLTGPKIEPVKARSLDRFDVKLDAPVACPKFAGRVIRGLENRRPTPIWMRERLRRAGLRSISPIVDVTNYVLLDLGQPMHAYDLMRLKSGIRVRMAAPDESITLLDGRTVRLASDILVIADGEGPVGAAGIMGGERTAVAEGTVDVFFESAWFSPDAVAGRARRLGLHTDASQRFERGVDPANQERAVEYATQLLLTIAGGTPGPLIVTQAEGYLPERPAVRLRRSQLARLLGTTIEPDRVEGTFAALQMNVARTLEGWTVTPPPHRFDINIEADLIEEVARIVGFDAIPEKHALTAQRFPRVPEARAPERSTLEALADRGYYEAITYAFVDPVLQARLFPNTETLTLSNPIASDLSTMRVSLWPGLLRAALENERRQQDRIRLFEHGARFVIAGGSVREIDTLAGLALGPRLPEQWGVTGEAKNTVDFFDVKADVEALLSAAAPAETFRFEAAQLSCLHPGRTARIVRRTPEGEAKDRAAGQAPDSTDIPIGYLGELHPTLVRELGFTQAPVLFELDYSQALNVELPRFREVSRFPQVRRDIAVVVDEIVALSALRERVILSASKLLQSVRIFDIYRGPGVEKGRKSVALGLIFQDFSRTLTDEEVDQAVATVLAELRVALNARIRE